MGGRTAADRPAPDLGFREGDLRLGRCPPFGFQKIMVPANILSGENRGA
jgi:hypothetical protein